HREAPRALQRARPAARADVFVLSSLCLPKPRPHARAALPGARRSAHEVWFSALGLRLYAGARSSSCLSRRGSGADVCVFAKSKGTRRAQSHPLLGKPRAGVASAADGAGRTAPAAPL